MKVSEFRKLIREEVRKVIREANNDEQVIIQIGQQIDDKIYKDESFTATINDILAEDWYVVKSEILYPFEEAIASLRKGKSIKRKTWINRFSVDADDNNYYFTIDDLNANDWIIKERN